MDFAVLPPEVNSGRMYAGAGAGPLLAAAAAWDQVAGEFGSAASSYRQTIERLSGGLWFGASAAAMAAAAAPYVAWLDTTAVAAEQTAVQARSSVTAYEAAFSATVPPWVVAANRSSLAVLVATNFLGINAPAIAATEAAYAEMWAQDATAMYTYAGSAATATVLTPFLAAAQNTNPAAASNQTAAVGHATGTAGSHGLSGVPNVLQAAASGSSGQGSQWLLNLLTSPPIQAIEQIYQATSGSTPMSLGGFVGSAGTNVLLFPLEAALEGPAIMAMMAANGSGVGLAGSTTATPGPAGAVGAPGGLPAAGAPPTVLAGVGRAVPVGGLSVPQSWASAGPQLQLASAGTALPASAPPMASVAGSGGWFGGPPAVGSVVNTPRQDGPDGARYGLRPAGVGASGGQEALVRRANTASALSERERDELDAMRKEITELLTRRDAARRMIKEAMRS